MYAIVRTGGKQYRVEEGRTLTVARLSAEEGSQVELDDVLLIAEDGDVTVGTPAIEGARVLANVEAHGRDKKIIVFKYKAKVRTRKKTGHRQAFTRLAVQEILRPGQPSKVKKPRPRRRKAAEEAEEPPAAEAAVETPSAEAAETVEAPAEAPKRRTRRTTAEPKTPARKPRTRKSPEAKAEAETPGETPKRRTRKAPAAKAEEPETGAEEKKPARRRATRRSTAPKQDEE